jgi:hypothetical protein
MPARQYINSCINTTHAGSEAADPAKWRVTQEMMEREIRNVREKGKNRGMIGFQPPFC